MEENAVRKFAATFVTDTTNRPAPRARRLRRGRVDLVEVADVILALILFATTSSQLTNSNNSQHGGLEAGILALIAFVNCGGGRAAGAGGDAAADRGVRAAGGAAGGYPQER